jgi:hypothetical protein
VIISPALTGDGAENVIEVIFGVGGAANTPDASEKHTAITQINILEFMAILLVIIYFSLDNKIPVNYNILAL